LPSKPKKPCSHPGCPKLTDGRFCEAHAKQDAREYDKYRRDPETGKRYGREWRAIRKRYIALHPLCERCEAGGLITPAREVHHVKPLSEGGTHDEDNLMALCSSCHSGFTLGENNRRRKEYFYHGQGGQNPQKPREYQRRGASR
jgi:5-methylcytosine-specific restriction protein A